MRPSVTLQTYLSCDTIWRSCPPITINCLPHTFMAPKTEFSIPLQKTVNVVTHTRRSNREVRTTEKVALKLPSKKPPLPSGSHHKVGRDAQSVDGCPPYLASQNIMETHPLRMTDPQEVSGAMEDLEDIDKHSNVSITIYPYLDGSHPFCRHQWDNGCICEQDISIYCWRWRDSPGLLSVSFAARQWR
jgi:hypothetical protein